MLGSARVPKVVLIVGPVGSLTPSYRSQADAAARAATAAGAQVVRVYSPNATWPAVRRATEGASIVVYLGHGNGWPSRYRDRLYPPTQDGFGLNPVAGVDDVAHQYFGEASIKGLHLAANAVVVLNHLCYASGNTEPGLPEGTVDQAIQRVDNYASGFLRAGASAVVAEGHLAPAYYVNALLTSRLSIEQIWQRSPSAKGNAFSVPSVRSPGYTARLDPDRTSGGYFRSLVSAGVDANAVRAGARGTAGAVVVGPPAPPSLVGRGLRFGTPSLRAMPVADTTTRLTLPLSKAGRASLPRRAEVGIRWDPILLDPVPASEPSAAVEPVDPNASPSATPGASPSATPEATPDPNAEAPEVDLVVPEQLGSVVTLTSTSLSSKGVVLDVQYPSAPGLYRLVPSLHTPSGIAYDAATQALLTPVLVRVGGPGAVAYGVPSSMTIGSGAAATVAVRVLNAGSQAWDQASDKPPAAGGEELLAWLRTSHAPARLVATWVSTAGLAVPAPATAVIQPEDSGPGAESALTLDLVAPVAPGEYLLLLDVVSPALGPLSALGNAPGLVRVTVSPPVAAPAPLASPPPDAAPSPLAAPVPGASPAIDPAPAG